MKQILITVAHNGESDFKPFEQNQHILYTGIGKLNAYESLHKFFKFKDPKDFVILNIGTCGSPYFPVGTPLLPQQSEQGDAFLQEGFTKDTRSFIVNHSAYYLQSLSNYQKIGTILTSDQFINEQSPLFKLAQEHHAQAFDMETYAQVKFAADNFIPFFAIKFVSDNCDGSIKDWFSVLDTIRPLINSAITDFIIDVDNSFV